MKTIDKMSRLCGMLEKAFRVLNAELFEGKLPMPIITVVPSSRSYAHYTVFDAWDTKNGGKREINIASGTLDRPIENIVASLVHEMVHMNNDLILNLQDTSNKGVYHNRLFRQEAEAHGLIVTRSEKYGWSHTEPGDELLDVILEHEDVFREIELCRTNPYPSAVGIGSHTGSGGLTPITTGRNTHHRKYICPCCGNSVRATKAVNIGCLDCGCAMVEA